MKAPRHCEECGQELPSHAPEGLCPNCLLGLAAAELGLTSEVQSPKPKVQSQHGEVQGSSIPREAAAEDGKFQVQASEAAVRSAEPGEKAEQGEGRGRSSKGGVQRFGNYELLEKIAEGGMGVVYKARQLNLDRLVAVKLLPFGPFSREDAVQRFRAEAAAAARLQHPNIVAIHEVSEHEGQHYFSMDLIVGHTLAEMVRDQPLSAKRAAAYLKTIAGTVHYAHEHGILHRDLKPSNVIVDASDQPHITDFGLAKRLDDSALCTLHSPLTLTGQVLGSPNFMSPEQASGRTQAIGPASDIYSLGALLYHLLTRQPPFQADTLTTLLQQVVATEPVPPRLINPNIPRDLETICLKCLEKEPARRYPTTQGLAEDLDRFLEDKPIQARPVSAAGKAWKWCRRRPALAGMGAALALTFVVGLAGVLWEWRQATDNERFARQNAYAADMKLAQHALEHHDLGLAASLLNKYRPSTDLPDWEWRYLWQFCQENNLLTLHRYTNGIDAVAPSPDRKLMAVASSGEVSLWNLAQRRQVSGFRAGISSVRALSLANERLAIAVQDATGQAWVELRELSAGTVIQRLKQEAAAGSLVLSPDGKLLAASHKDGSVWVVDSNSGQTLARLTRPPTRNEAPPMLAFSPEGGRLVIGEGWSGHARLLDVKQGTVFDLPTQSGACVSALAFAPGADLLAGGYDYYANSNRIVSLWDARSGELRGQLPNDADAVTALFFTSDGRRLVAANRDGSVRIWSVAKRTELESLQSPRKWPLALALLPDDRTLVVAEAKSVFLWDLAARGPAPAHTTLVTASPFEALRDLEPQDYKGETLHPLATGRLALAFTADSRGFITTDPDGLLALWDTWPVRLKEKLTLLGTNHWGVALSPDGRWLAAGHAPPGKITIWDWPARRAVTNLDVPFDFLGTLRFSRSGNFLVSWVFDNQARISTRLWHSGDWTEVPLSRRQLPGAWSVDLSPDERLLAAGYNDTVKVFRFPSGEQEASFRHDGRVVAALFSSEGHRLISATWNDSVKLWDLAARRWRADLEGRFDGLWAAALSPNGRRLATAGQGPTDTVKVWDLVARRELLSLSAEGIGLLHLAFSPDGNTLAAVALSGTTHLWHAPSWEEIAAVEKGKVTP